ncbi:MAG: hypothetical protein HQ509_12125 [Candidatus Marinimicrobia bacterium]|nr:hypothetical protein [Candidatus Neomarinimicrobiota bacterium]
MQRIIVFSFLILFQISVFGQETDSPLAASANVNVSATVVGAIEMVTLQDIDIGVVTPSMEFIIIDPGENPGAGLIKFTGQPSMGIRIVFSKTVVMVAGDGSTLTVQYLVNGNSNNEQGTSIPMEESPAQVVLNPDGEYFVWIGCQMDIREVVSGQQYDGDFVIEVEYN